MSLVLSGTNGLSDVDGSAATPAIRGTDTNTGIFFPAADTIAFAEGGVESARFDPNGNLGLKVTPSASWQAGRAVMQIGPAMAFDCNSPTQALVSANRVFTGSQDLYLNSGNATAYQQLNGAHAWFNAPSGTAGNAISFTQAMTLTAGGNQLLGTTTSPSSTLIRQVNAGDGVYSQWTRNVTTIGGGYVGTDGAGLIFGTHSGNVGSESYAERARITSSGDLLVATNTSGGQGGISVRIGGFTPNVLFNRTSTTAQSFPLEFQNAGTIVGYVGYNNTSTFYVTSSDYRLKEDIQPMTGALAKVAALKPCTYKWKADGSDGEGFIAHELAEVCPQAVVGEKDAVDADGKPQYQGIDTSFLVATLTAAIQEQQAIITALTARVTALEGTQP
jgi:hypothetical protein